MKEKESKNIRRLLRLKRLALGIDTSRLFALYLALMRRYQLNRRFREPTRRDVAKDRPRRLKLSLRDQTKAKKKYPALLKFVNVANTAINEDKEGRYKKAVKLYTKCLRYLHRLMKKYDGPKDEIDTKKLRAQCIKFILRIRKLNSFLNNRATNKKVSKKMKR